MRKVIESIGVLTAERVIQLVLSAAVSVVLTRALGPSGFGTYAFAVSSVALVGPLVDVGQSILVRDLVSQPQRTRQLLRTAARLAAMLAGGIQVLAIGFALVLPAHLSQAGWPVVLTAFALLLRPVMVLDYWFQSRLDARRAAGARLSGTVVSSALRFGLALHGGDHVLPLLAATAIVETAVTALVMLLQFRRHEGEPGTEVLASATTYDYFKKTAPLMVAALSIAIYMRLDQVMLGFLASTDQVGQYAAAVRLSEFTYFLPVVLMTSLAPGLTAMFVRDREAFVAIYDRVVSAFMGVALVLVVTLVGLSSVLVSIIYGSGFDDAAAVLRVHVLSMPFVFLGVAQTTWTAVFDQQGLSMWRTISGAVINTALNFVLIPPLGALGAAYATVAAYAFSSVLGNVMSPRTRPFLWLQLRQFNPVHVTRNLLLLRHDVMARLAARQPQPASTRGD